METFLECLSHGLTQKGKDAVIDQYRKHPIITSAEYLAVLIVGALAESLIHVSAFCCAVVSAFVRKIQEKI